MRAGRPDGAARLRPAGQHGGLPDGLDELVGDTPRVGSLIRPRSPMPVVAMTMSSGVSRQRRVAARRSLSSASGTILIAGAASQPPCVPWITRDRRPRDVAETFLSGRLPVLCTPVPRRPGRPRGLRLPARPVVPFSGCTSASMSGSPPAMSAAGSWSAGAARPRPGPVMRSRTCWACLRPRTRSRSGSGRAQVSWSPSPWSGRWPPRRSQNPRAKHRPGGDMLFQAVRGAPLPSASKVL